MPERIQRQRVRGWRAPEGAIYVGRPSKWGNPFVVGEEYAPYQRHGDASIVPGGPTVKATPALAVAMYAAWLEEWPAVKAAARRELAGHDLMCWCPADQACHADYLLVIANE